MMEVYVYRPELKSFNNAPAIEFTEIEKAVCSAIEEDVKPDPGRHLYRRYSSEIINIVIDGNSYNFVLENERVNEFLSGVIKDYDAVKMNLRTVRGYWEKDVSKIEKIDSEIRQIKNWGLLELLKNHFKWKKQKRALKALANNLKIGGGECQKKE
jgi:hypothetical protein